MLKFALLIVLFAQEDSLLEKLEREISGVVRKVRPSVVAVEVKTSLRPEPQVELDQTLRLSGIIYRKDGYIVTDAGAVAEANSIRVTLWDGRTLEARLIAADLKSGIAVLRVEAQDLPAAELGKSTDLRAGSFAIAVGNAHGLQGSASLGTISGSSRSVRVAGRKIDDLLQLTAPAYPGDCGGFVADSRGRMVGIIHSVFDSETDSEDFFKLLFGRGSSGPITFAVPSEVVEFVAERIIKHKRMIRGWIGVSVRSAEGGAEIVRIESGSPARKAGLHKGDVIVAWDGESILDVPSLQKRVERIEEPRQVRLAVQRGPARIELEIRVELEK